MAAQSYNQTCHPTIGGLLIFCSTVPDEYSYAGFRVSRFKAENRAELINSTIIDDGLLVMPEKVMDFVRLYMERKIVITALRRKEEYDIPLPAIREGILNAICHRDYSLLGSREIAKKLNIHQNTALKRLKSLEGKGLIFKKGSGPRVRYSI